MYLFTLAPGVTFWDAGEFIAAAHGFGIPHPPGTPLYVAIGRAWTLSFGWLLGTARAMNLLSAACTALAGALTTLVIARETHASRDESAWGAVAAGVVAGLMCSAWSNATETEVYAVSLLHVMAMLACAQQVRDDRMGRRWLALTAYFVALAPALHLSALVGVPAVVVLASRRASGGWAREPAVLLGGTMLAAAGVGRMSLSLVALGLAVVLIGTLLGARTARGAGLATLLLVPLGASALLIMLLRARMDPAINQGNPATLAALADVVARRQYDVASIFPRQAPLWLQAANLAQYADWQVAMGWGHGIFTTPARVIATVAYVALAVAGWRAMRRDAPRLALTLLALVACGSVGVMAYLNMKAGASLGWGLLAEGTPHEARERDYFFVLGFWGWACLAAWGALALARKAGRPRAALAVALVPLVGNWTSVDRRAEPVATAPRVFAHALLDGLPPRTVLFTSGDNDSYPLWYLQQVEGTRTDVQLVTLPLLPAAWYEAEIARRTGLRWSDDPVAGARWQHESAAAHIAAAVLAAGRPVAASVALSAHERDLLGSRWTLRGAVYLAGGAATANGPAPALDSAGARAWLARVGVVARPADDRPDHAAGTMLGLLECPRLALPWTGPAPGRDSLEVRCNFR